MADTSMKAQEEWRMTTKRLLVQPLVLLLSACTSPSPPAMLHKSMDRDLAALVGDYVAEVLTSLP